MQPIIQLENIQHFYKKTQALAGVSLQIEAGKMVGFIGPDGVGKSTLLALIAGASKLQTGSLQVLGGDMQDKSHRDAVQPQIAYMPQGLGKNLYPTLSIEENLQFFGHLFGHNSAERRNRIDELTKATGLFPFLKRPAGKLSGGMKQKLGLCCALIHDPDLLILDEPTTGVDPLARAQFWDLIAKIRQQRPTMSVLVATAYMDEASGFDWLVAMDEGQLLTCGTPSELLAQTASKNLETAFLKLLPPEKIKNHAEVVIPPLEAANSSEDIAIEAQDLTMKFGDFVAVDKVSFKIQRGEIFGFLGSNGCGKTTTMKMLTGLLPASSGQAWLFGQQIDAEDLTVRRRVGYMSQQFSLYSELSVLQNLEMHAKIFAVPQEILPQRIEESLHRFGLTEIKHQLPKNLPLGIRQRLSLAVAMVHQPELLILDEPTSGVDPVARDEFWRLLVELSRRDKVTIFISTHFMNEAERCDRMSMMHAGRVLDSDTPANLVAKRGAKNLEEAFIGYLLEEDQASAELDLKQLDLAAQNSADNQDTNQPVTAVNPTNQATTRSGYGFNLQRAFSYAWRESLELQRDPVRATLALLGSFILMLVMGFGISMDVSDLTYAVLDRDQTNLSQNYQLEISGSRYFIEKPPLKSYQELDLRMKSGELALALEIPPNFARDVMAGKQVAIGAWFDGAMPMRAETVKGYVQGLHYHWLAEQANLQGIELGANVEIETRFRYNPDVKSLPAIVPTVIPLLLLMLPAMLTALAVVREKELGSIINLYVTPVSRLEFLLGKQLPYVGLAMVNYFLMVLLAVYLFQVPITGSFFTLTLAALLFSFIATGMGLLASSVTNSQIAAMFFAMIGTMIPASQFGGMLEPVSSLQGAARVLGEIYPASHMFVISRGVFNKALELPDLWQNIWPLLLAAPIILGASVALLKKQAR